MNKKTRATCWYLDCMTQRWTCHRSFFEAAWCMVVDDIVPCLPCNDPRNYTVEQLDDMAVLRWALNCQMELWGCEKRCQTTLNNYEDRQRNWLLDRFEWGIFV